VDAMPLSHASRAMEKNNSFRWSRYVNNVNMFFVFGNFNAPGVNVMNAIFGDFDQFSTKNGDFLLKQCKEMFHLE
jgi:hypothetical protein